MRPFQRRFRESSNGSVFPIWFPRHRRVYLALPARAGAKRWISFPQLVRRAMNQQLGNRLTVEVRGQIASEKRIDLGAPGRFFDLITMLALRTVESDESSRESHLRIQSPQTVGLLYPAASVDAAGGVGFVFAHPLFVGFGNVPGVGPCQRPRLAVSELAVHG